MDSQAASVLVNAILATLTVGVLIMNYFQVRANRRQVQASEEQASVMREQVRVSQEQVSVSREQVRQSQQQVRESLDASHRPFLIPFGSLPLVQDGEGRASFDFHQLDPGPQLALRNVGSGIALNIHGVFVQPLPDIDVDLHLAPRMWRVVLALPLPVGDQILQTMYEAAAVGNWNTIIGTDPRNTLCAPKYESRYRVMGRLTLTFDDLSGHTYAAQFDYLEHERWVFHTFGRTTSGLPALADEHDQRNGANQIALQGILAAERDPRGSRLR